MDTRHQWLSLAMTPGLGPASIKRLRQHFGSVGEILSADRKALAGCSFLRKDSLAALTGQKTSLFAAAEQELRLAEKAGAAVLCWDDPLFPPLLLELADPPPLLYVLGSPEILSSPGLAIVGARAASAYGLQTAERMSRDLARQDLTIISGFALGVDTAAHRGALAVGGKTIAVLGCGLDIVYPPQNGKLYGQIAASGAVISECPFGTRPDGFRFPARNRIISGLALGVLVVEAAQRSGTLITAHQALEQGRDVFAVPGRLDSAKSEGCHRLIQDGAKLVLNAADILAELAICPSSASGAAKAERPLLPPLSPEEKKVFSLLEACPRNIEELIEATGLSASGINGILLTLELQGLIFSSPGKQYQRLAE